MKVLQTKKEINTKELLIFCFNRCAQYKRMFLTLLFFVSFSSLLSLSMPIITKYIIDDIIMTKNIHNIHWVMIATLAIIILDRVINYYFGVVMFYMTEKLVTNFRSHLLEELARKKVLAIRKFGGFTYIATRLHNDSYHVLGVFFDRCLDRIVDSLMIIFSLIFIFYFNWKLALVTISILPIYILITIFYSGKIKSAVKTFQEKTALERTSFQEGVEFEEMGKFYGAKYILRRYYGSVISYLKSGMNKIKLQSKTAALNGFFSSLIPLTVLFYGGHLVINDSLSIGALVAFLTLSRLFIGPVKNIVHFYFHAQTAISALERISEIYQIENDPSNKYYSETPLDNKLTFNNISFAYNENIILNNTSFDLNKGEIVGLIGKSGCGKSTLLRLISGIYAPKSGNITCSKNIITETLLRHNSVIQEQEPRIFEDTIKNNLKLSGPNILDDVISLVISKVNLEELYSRETGIISKDQLSTGQKQRISMARAILKDREILLFDEPTASLDPVSEQKVLEFIQEISRNKFIVIVTHKKETLGICNQIMQIRKNKIETVKQTNYSGKSKV